MITALKTELGLEKVMTNINRQEVTEYLADYGVPEFLIDLICEDESGDELVKGWHNAQLEYRYKVLSAIERLDLYADGCRIEKFIWDAVITMRKPYRAVCFVGFRQRDTPRPNVVPVVKSARVRQLICDRSLLLAHP